jgi:energy-coupling factor transporter ATP-binding protein EcfA2
MTDDARGPQAVAELQGVHKRYGKVEALGGVDLELRPGELVALLGPNGAGKTTAVSILLGQRRPDAGSARLFGRDPTLPATRPCPRPAARSGSPSRRAGSPTTSPSERWSTWSASTTPTPHQPRSSLTGSASPRWPAGAPAACPAARRVGWRWR